MATINQNGLPTLFDLAKRMDPDGSIAEIAETLTIESPLLQDLQWKEANGVDGHLVTTRTTLPALTWRRYNEGIDAAKSNTGQYTETLGMLEGRSVVDVDLAKRNGNSDAYRQSEDKAFVQSFYRTLETAFFYASTKTDPEQIHGLAPRFDALSGLTYQSQVISFGAAAGADNSSVWLIGHGDRKVYGLYPKGEEGTAGLSQEDMGIEYEADSNNKKFRAYRTHFQWKCGLCVEDARYVVRLCNIDDDVLVDTGNALIFKLAEMLEQINSLEGCKPVFYMSRRVRSFLRRQCIDSTKNSTLTYENVGGKPVLMFSGVPIHRSDAILNTESPVT